jgi:hypothetical protein
MTVIAAVRTGAAAVLVADSKISTQGLAGLNPDGTPLYLPQTYDHAVKISRDLSDTAIAAFSGYGSIGEQTTADYFSRLGANLLLPSTEQDSRVQEIAAGMVAARTAFSMKFKIPAEQVPTTILLLAAPPRDAVAPRVWRIELNGTSKDVSEILSFPGVWFEGDVNAVLTLLYGSSSIVMEGLRQELGVDPKRFQEALFAQQKMTAVSQVNFWTMPTQDAMDFAVFCATVQIEMDRFLPGFGSCGGPVDLMTLEMAPAPHITSFSGKSLHHPASTASN